MTVFRHPFDLFDILDVYSQPQRELIPILALDNKRKQRHQKRCSSDMKTSKCGDQGPSGAGVASGADSNVNQNQKQQEFSEHATKKVKIGNDDSSPTTPFTTPFHSPQKGAVASSLSPLFSFLRNGGEQFMRVDIQENESTYQFQVDLPGVSRNQIDLDLDENNLLTISARREKYEDKIVNAQEVIPENTGKTTDRETKTTSNETESGPTTTTNTDTANDKVDDNVNVNVDVNANANIKDENDKTMSKYLLEERLYGKMERVFRLGKDVDSDNISASLENGVLKVTIPKVIRASPKKIAIN